jgi:SAM-dependent methyltransferase
MLSEIDTIYLAAMRSNIETFLTKISKKIQPNSNVLNVGCGDVDFRKYFPNSIYQTMDIEPNISATYHGSICNRNDFLSDNEFNYVLLIEVLEHVWNPFDAINEIKRILKPDGLVIVTVPFNFQHHSPDFWRFTSDGLRHLFKDFDSIVIDQLPCQDRPLMPIQYTLTARKK